MAQCTGMVEDRNESSITISGERYGSFKGQGLSAVGVGDTLDFLWNPSKCGRYRNIVSSTIKILAKGSGGGMVVSPTGYAASKPTFVKQNNTLGIELGHAANLAMEVALESCKSGVAPHSIGSDDFYKNWVHHLDKIHTIMSKVRASKEAKAEAAPAPKAPDPVLEHDEISVFS